LKGTTVAVKGTTVAVKGAPVAVKGAPVAVKGAPVAVTVWIGERKSQFGKLASYKILYLW